MDDAVIQFMAQHAGEHVSDKLQKLFNDRSYINDIIVRNEKLETEPNFLIIKLALSEKISTINAEIGMILAGHITIGKMEKITPIIT